MKGLDILIVRLLPFVLFIIFGINLTCVWIGIDITILYELHGNSILYALGLFLISLANNKYHCIWNRGMYLFLIIVPLINFADKTLDFIPIANFSLLTISIAYGITILYTSFMAIRHFIQLSIKRYGNGNNQY